MYTQVKRLLLATTLLGGPFTYACLHDHGSSAGFDVEISSALARRSALSLRDQPVSQNKTALLNVRIFDGYKVLEPTTLVIDGSTISFDTSNITSVTDCLGGILIPGLIDSHAHPNTLDDLAALSSYGVTTVMNMVCRNYTLCNALRNQPGLTSFFTAGIGATGPNSTHAFVFQVPPDQLIYSPAQAPDFVTWAFNNGSDYYKITAEFNGPNQTTQNLLVQLTHKLGKQAMTHAADIASYLQAIASRTDGIQHTPGDGLITDEMVKQMYAQRQYITPTMALVKAFLGSPAAVVYSSYNSPGSWDRVVQNVKAMHEGGLPLLAGTDAVGVIAAYNVTYPFGISLHEELGYLVEAGMTPAEALRAATLVPNWSHRLGDRGMIKEGFRADLVLLGSDPTVNVSNTKDIKRVWIGGVEYPEVAHA